MRAILWQPARRFALVNDAVPKGKDPRGPGAGEFFVVRRDDERAPIGAQPQEQLAEIVLNNDGPAHGGHGVRAPRQVIVFHVAARCSAPRWDNAKIVYVGFEAPSVGKMPGPAM